jgi:hypothetical protein
MSCSDLEAGRQGPISKEEVRQLASRGALTPATPMWVAGMAQPLPLGAIRELRWWTARGLGESALVTHVSVVDCAGAG